MSCGVKKVGVIGGGAAGLCAARHCTAPRGTTAGGGGGLTVTVFERGPQPGGTWVYTESTGTDEHGLPIHSSMYKNLRTNLPKEVMGFPDYPIPENEKSYISSNEILSFLNSYADYFDIRQFIKFNHYVTNVSPKSNGGWNLEAIDLDKNEQKMYEFDAIMVCNGHYHTPLYPKIDGIETFSGTENHSHDYRMAEIYKDKTVLVIGGGPSGNDIALDISSVTKTVILSHHIKEGIQTQFPRNIFQKPDVLKVDKSTVVFTDGSRTDVDCILHCTGYRYDFPFLSESCDIVVKDNCVQPLYGHFISINHPTMCFIGLPYYVCAFTLFDLQVRAFLRMFLGEVKLPSRESMLSDMKQEIEERRKQGLKEKHFHMMGELQGDYYSKLAAMGHLTPVPTVLAKLHNESSRRFLEDLVNYRNDVYRIIDDENYIIVK